MDDIAKYFRVLELPVDASESLVRETYKDLIKVWHPDRFSQDLALQMKANRKLQEINEAYSIICNYFINCHSFTDKDTDTKTQQQKNKTYSSATAEQYYACTFKTITVDELTVTDKSFLWKGVMYKFPNIKHIRWYRQIAYTNMGTRKSQDGAFLQLHLRNDEKISIAVGQVPRGIGYAKILGLFTKPFRSLSSISKDCENLARAYGYLSRVTYKNRLKDYMDQMAGFGYFLYDGKKIFPDGRVAKGSRVGNLKTAFHINEPLFLEDPFNVHLQADSKFSLGITISTETDRDVFETFIDHVRNGSH